MNVLPIPPAHDLVQFPANSATEMARRYRKWLLGGPAAFSNTPAKQAARFALTREISLELLIKSVRQLTRPKGRDANEQVIEAIWRFGEGRNILVHPAPKWRFDFSAESSLKISADLLIVENDEANLLWIQARRGGAPSISQLGMLQRLFLLRAQDSDFEGIGLTILDMHEVSDGRRVVRPYALGDLPIASESEAKALLQTFSDAHAMLITEGFEKVRSDHRNRQKRQPPGQGEFFD